MQVKQAPTRIARFLLCAILAGWFAQIGRAQAFPPPSPGATSCSNPGANWLTCTISGQTLTLGAASGQASHRVIGTCGSATSFGPCSLVAGDLPSIPLSTGVTGVLPAANLPAPAGGGPPGGIASITSGTGAISTTETTITSYTIPANSVQAGTTYRLTAIGNASVTSSTPAGVHFYARFGSTGTSSDTAIGSINVTSATSGTAINFTVVMYVTFQSATVSQVQGFIENATNTGIYTGNGFVGNTTNTTGLTTTSNEILQLSFVSAGSTVSATLNQAFIELVKP